MKQLAQKLVLVAWNIYIIFTVLSVPLFNWRYAREHGFASWIFFGEVVATAKAVAWPYYTVTALQRRGDNQASESEIDAHFVNSRRASHRALLIVNDERGILELSNRQKKEAVPLFETAVAEATLVQDAFLYKIHADFPRHWKNEYTSALKDIAEGLKTTDEQKIIVASKKYKTFSDWVRDHVDEMQILQD